MLRFGIQVIKMGSRDKKMDAPKSILSGSLHRVVRPLSSIERWLNQLIKWVRDKLREKEQCKNVQTCCELKYGILGDKGL